MEELVQYIVINADLPMSPGKIGAQCGHAVSLMMSKYFEYKKIEPVWPQGGDRYLKIRRVEKWSENNYPKIIKKASGKKFQKLKELGGEFVVVDLGRTELVGQNETAIGFWPMKRIEAPKELEKLRLLQEERVENLEKALCSVLGLETHWPLTDVLNKLIESSKHLLHDHACDKHGYETINAAIDSANDLLIKIHTAHKVLIKE